MNILPNKSIHLVVTSPPYIASKEYEKDWSIEEYLDLIKDVFKEIYKKLVPGGRVCINIANMGRSPYIPLNSFITQEMIDIGYLMRGEIIWDKGASVGTSTAWGSWKSASNPVLRDQHEYILVFSKDTFTLKSNGENTISKEEFLEYSKSIWKFPTTSAKEIGHPAPFPVELPYRAIQLFTKKQNIVMDPFIGSGTTAIAAIKSNRHFVGFDKKEEYVDLSKDRINEYVSQKNLEDFM